MTQEQFNKVCDINRRLDLIKYTKELIEREPDEFEIKLGFFQWNDCYEKWQIVSTEILDPILAKHEKMIRQEIDEQINKLKKEIEEI